MAFKIRSACVNVERAEYESKEKLYREFLRQSTDKESDLWRYFYYDTFHDGRIEKISFGKTLAEITLHISCPNIKQKEGNSFRYARSVDFECRFVNVVYLSHEYDSSIELIDESDGYIEYMFCEIDTLTKIINRNFIKGDSDDGDEDVHFQSLIIELAGNNTGSTLELVFGDVWVYPKEPVAFELMLQSENFFVPVYNKDDENFEKMPKWAI